jgi:hypothetical protein
MSIAVDNRERAWIHEPEPWLKRGIEYCFEHLAIGQREIVSELVKESGQMIPEAMDHRPEFRFRVRNSDRRAKCRRFPPTRVDLGQHSHSLVYLYVAGTLGPGWIRVSGTQVFDD